MGAPTKSNRVDAVAFDLDGTIRSSAGVVSRDLLAQFASLRREGVKLILATGRALLDLKSLIDISNFDAVIVENGAILVVDGKQESLAPPEWEAQRKRLLELFTSTGHEQVIVALRRDMEPRVREILGDGVKVEDNKEAMMLVPWNVSKGSGLVTALRELGVDPGHVMCIGDGENDLSMFRVAGIRVAVRNAVPILQSEADYVTSEENGKGVSEAITKFCGALS